MKPQDWKERFEDDEDVTHIFTTNQEVLEMNHKQLMELAQPIALIEAVHTGRSKKMKSDNFRQLESTLFLAVGALILLTSNICQPAGLCNGATGVVKAIIYRDGEGPPSLPWFVLVDFGDDYKGPTFFPDDDHDKRQGYVPVHAITASEYTRKGDGYEEHTRTMLPIKLAWAWTTWKVQGQTLMGKVVIHMGKTEKEHGLTYTAFSRATRLRNLGIDGGFYFDRFTSKIKNHKKMAPRILEEKRLRELSKQTIELLRECRVAIAHQPQLDYLDLQL